MIWYYGLFPTDKIKIENKYYYISNFFPNINIMFSIWPMLSSCKNYYAKIKNSSFRKYFSIPNRTKVIADSGSFGFYRMKKNTQLEWNLNAILKVYDLISPNFAVHNDTPVAFLKKSTNIEIEKLLNKNLANAKKFLNVIKTREFKPIGVAQGINDLDYIHQIQELYHLGYKYIGLGGIAYLSSKKIVSLFTQIFKNSEIRKLKVKFHVFGVGRFDILKRFPIHSFDNTSPLNDSHRDKQGKNTFYYIMSEKKNKLCKSSLIKLQKKKYNIKCECPICKILKKEILYTGSALRNHSRAFHNAYIYQKVINSF